MRIGKAKEIIENEIEHCDNEELKDALNTSLRALDSIKDLTEAVMKYRDKLGEYYSYDHKTIFDSTISMFGTLLIAEKFVIEDRNMFYMNYMIGDTENNEVESEE